MPKGTDPTLRTLAKFDDPSQWDHIEENVPIFMAHEMYQDDDGKYIVRLPGAKKPTNAKFLYAVTDADLDEIADEIQRNFDEYAKPMKIFIGHTATPKNQNAQPELVGYATVSGVGPHGPKGRKAILAKEFFSPGKFAKAKDFPDRSPEFFPNSKAMTSIALLKTEPRLPMGMTTYAHDGAIFYGQGFDMATARKVKKKQNYAFGDDEPGNDKKPPMPPTEPDEQPGEAPPDEQPQDAPQDPVAEPDADALSPEEQQAADRVWKYFCAKPEFVKLMNPAPASPAPEPPPSNAPPEPDKEPEQDPTQMANDTAPVQYAQLQAEQKLSAAKLKGLEEKLALLASKSEMTAQKYAQERARRILIGLAGEGVKLTNPISEEKRMCAMSEKEQDEWADHMRVNYAREEVAPVGGPMIDIFDGPVEGPAVELKPNPQQTAEVVRYAEAHDIDVSTDEGWAQAVEAVMKPAPKKGKK